MTCQTTTWSRSCVDASSCDDILHVHHKNAYNTTPCSQMMMAILAFGGKFSNSILLPPPLWLVVVWFLLSANFPFFKFGY